jgi:hypothetical protein
MHVLELKKRLDRLIGPSNELWWCRGRSPDLPLDSSKQVEAGPYWTRDKNLRFNLVVPYFLCVCLSPGLRSLDVRYDNLIRLRSALMGCVPLSLYIAPTLLITGPISQPNIACVWSRIADCEFESSKLTAGPCPLRFHSTKSDGRVAQSRTRREVGTGEPKRKFTA